MASKITIAFLKTFIFCIYRFLIVFLYCLFSFAILFSNKFVKFFLLLLTAFFIRVFTVCKCCNFRCLYFTYNSSIVHFQFFHTGATVAYVGRGMSSQSN